MNDIDELAHQSAASVRASVAHLAVPPTPGRSVLKPVLRLGAVAAVVAGLIFVFLILPNGGPMPIDVAGEPTTEPAGSSATQPIPYFEFDVPEGWVLSVVENPAQMYGLERVNMTLAYGAGSSADPFAKAGIMLSFIEGLDNSQPPPSGDHEIFARGHRAEHYDSLDGFASIRWDERSDLFVALRSQNYGVDDLVKIADNLLVDGFNVTLSNPPDGMTLVASVGTSESDLARSGASRHPTSWSMSITSGTDTRMNESVETVNAHFGLFELVKYADPSAVEVTVRGTTGLLESLHRYPDPETQSPPVPGAQLQWIEDGQAFMLTVIGPGDPVAIANSLRRIDRARFDELSAATQTPSTFPAGIISPPTTFDPEGPPGPATTVAVP